MRLNVVIPRKRSLKDGDTFGLKKIGFHRTLRGWEYDLQFDPDEELAQAVLRTKGEGEGHVLLALRADS